MAGTDYGSVADFTVRIPAGSTSGSETFTLMPVDDAVDEEDETVTVGGSVTGLTVTGTAVAITDDDGDADGGGVEGRGGDAGESGRR